MYKQPSYCTCIRILVCMDDIVHYIVELQDSTRDGDFISATAIIVTALVMLGALSALTIIIIVVLCMKKRPKTRDGISKSTMRCM